MDRKKPLGERLLIALKAVKEKQKNKSASMKDLTWAIALKLECSYKTAGEYFEHLRRQGKIKTGE